MIEILNKVLANLDAMQRSAAASFDYSQTKDALDALGAAVDAAKQADDAEASSFWSDISRAVKHNVNFFSERERFYRDAARIKSGASTALASVEALCAGKIAPHAPVPAQLMNDARTWNRRASQVRSLQAEAEQLARIPGWAGDASANYSSAASVQVAALTELDGVMQSTAQGCVAGAQLNRALFFVAAKAIKQATARIKSSPGRSGDTYYVRTATAWSECEALVSQLRPVTTGAAAAGSITSLASECARTVTMPNLLSNGSWPTGTGAAGVPPADTRDGVTNDGSTDLNAPDPTGGRCLPGVNM